MNDSSDDSELNVVTQQPTPAEIREATEIGLREGSLPEFFDYGIVLPFLVRTFFKLRFNFAKIKEAVPWLEEWGMNPLNASLLEEELERVVERRIQRIIKHIEFLAEGGVCCRLFGRFGYLFTPLGAMVFRAVLFCLDCIIILLWRLLFDYWLGKFIRLHVIARLMYYWTAFKMKVEECCAGDSLFLDEELKVRNIYDSMSYRIANVYACLLLLALSLALAGVAITTVGLWRLVANPDSTLLRLHFALGLLLLGPACCCLQMFCRCTL